MTVPAGRRRLVMRAASDSRAGWRGPERQEHGHEQQRGARRQDRSRPTTAQCQSSMARANTARQDCAASARDRLITPSASPASAAVASSARPHGEAPRQRPGCRPPRAHTIDRPRGARRYGSMSPPGSSPSTKALSFGRSDSQVILKPIMSSSGHRADCRAPGRVVISPFPRPRRARSRFPRSSVRRFRAAR